MSKFLYLTIFGLAIGLAYASSQTTAGTASQSQHSGPQTTPAQQSGSSQGTTQPPATQSKPSEIAPGGATDASGGGVVGAAGSAPAKSQAPEGPETPTAVAALPDGELQSQIQNALSKEPTLSGDTINVNVSSDAIEVTGSVATAREKQTATRIIQSYAGNKKVVSHLSITGRNRNAASAAATPK
jgi:BON domain